MDKECAATVERKLGWYVLRYGPTPILKIVGFIMWLEGHAVRAPWMHEDIVPPAAFWVEHAKVIPPWWQAVIDQGAAEGG